MNQANSLTQAYSQTPWRTQTQILAWFSVLVIVIASAATIYLSITAQTTKIGREIQEDQAQIQDLQIKNSDLLSQLANLTATDTMVERATALGFIPADTHQAIYLVVPGYTSRQPVSISNATYQPVVSAPALPPEYTESVLVWLVRQINQYSIPFLYWGQQ